MNGKRPIQDHALEAMPDADGIVLEDRLWWVRGRKAIILEYLKSAKRRGTISAIMDIGCGSGGNLDVLGDFARVFGVEPSETLARRAKGRGIAQVVFRQDARSLEECQKVELFTMFDVLEHIENDRSYLVGLRSKATQKHRLLVSVPACPFLYCEHDRILHHYRRYTAKTLRSTLEGSGYHVIHMSYFMFFLFPLVLFARAKDKLMSMFGHKSTSIDVGDVPAILSMPFASTLRLEALLSRKIRFPIGLWLFALAESNDGQRSSNEPAAGIQPPPAPITAEENPG
jgi:SAM-dependent methyltransferase